MGSSASSASSGSKLPILVERSEWEAYVPSPGAFEGKPRLTMAVMKPAHNAGRARLVVDLIQEEASDRYDTVHYVFPRRSGSPYYDFVEEVKQTLTEEDRERFSSRKGWSAPFVWLDMPDGTRKALGGRDDLCEWAMSEFASSQAIVRAAKTPAKLGDLWVDTRRPGTL
uniref:Uncharacterized protein n=1 Tax=Phaeomonas parva TaxID=124430 RepID=A0A6U4HY34_9STRA|mmetsp:Transcript_37787/g.118321  ORF Transcript_37787/g.118321 Transcript_37787/m.118321 type:complete len:169 (+) Transcript_37787:165-671(+)|eukprot:CAMPEP_0118853752 /NCGR_PEP_ID=MMETSP1163-20130328/2224_1 /TAXON_ID=124430 /ORGANISM="Phaeomonas parva, Strain CCMP2877" /LENGTH=168 /DNA_ID=CAMNT_0006786359 /DNA_START=194 /DNA_END=700 /DNA_ORIENTATION=+